MRRIIKKLNSKEGASIVISLLMFLVASFVSVVIVNAALVAVKRVNEERAEAKSYYAVNSAARLFTTSLKESKCTVTKTEITYEGEDGITTEIKYAGEGPLGALLEDLLKKANDPLPQNIREISVSVSDKDETNPDLDCSISVKIEKTEPESYEIDADFANNNNHIFLQAWIPTPPTPNPTVVSVVENGKTKITTTTVTEYVWSGTDLSTVKGAA